MLDHLKRLFLYDHWANREVLASLQSAGSPPPRSLRLFSHVLGTEYLWFGRIVGRGSTMPVWPDLTLAGCEEHAAELKRIWSGYLGRAGESSLALAVTYVNSKGESWTSSVQDILTHVVIHSAYHRGQIAAGMRAAGFTPAYTDFIHGMRRKLLE